jgi:hypothetical protein
MLRACGLLQALPPVHKILQSLSLILEYIPLQPILLVLGHHAILILFIAEYPFSTYHILLGALH